MPEALDRSDPRVSTSLLEWVDEVADRFEAAWKQGPAPRLADFLGGAAGPSRPALFRELIKIDLEYRWRAGDRRRLEDYLAEFPELLGPDGSLPDDLVLHAWRVRGRFSEQARAESPAGGPESTRVERPADLRCPQCGNSMGTAGSDAREVTCPACGGSFRVESGPG